MSTIPVLIVEDSPALAETYAAYLTDSGYHPVIAHTAQDACAKIDHHNLVAILLDLNLPDGNGIELLSTLRQQHCTTPVIVITAEPSIETAVEAIQKGAQDFISKPVTPQRLVLTLKNIIDKRALQSTVETYTQLDRHSFCDFIGASAQMQAVYRILENAASSKAPVFITGESGTGKELAARAIHTLSQRHTYNLEALNCAAIPGTLMESEIFGHSKGAFTGATENHTGAAQRADKGTLFLDELTEMPVDLQSKLLRFTQTGSFRPVGGQKELTVDVRFVCATNRSPMEAVRQGKLREDLYYRLNVLPVHLPPLRERGEDILLIAQYLVKKISTEEQKRFVTLADDVRDFMMTYAWPGNIRQLENVLRRAIVQHDGNTLTRSMMSLPTEEYTLPDAQSFTPPPTQEGIVPLRELEEKAIQQAIRLCNGNITEAARRLAINPSTIYRKIKKTS